MPAGRVMHWRSVLLSVALHVAVITPLLLGRGLVATREPPRIAVLPRREAPRPIVADLDERPPVQVRAEDPVDVRDVVEHEIPSPPCELEEPSPAPPDEASLGRRGEPTPNAWYARVRPAPPPEPLVLETTPLEGHAPPPRYPERAIRLGQQGEVVVRLHVDAAGSVTRVEIVRACRHRLLVDAVVRAVRDWRFRPAMRDGRPVPAVVERRFVFRIRPAVRAGR